MATPLNTDDSAQRLRYPWLGTPDVPMPIRAYMGTWVRLLVTSLTLCVFLWFVLSPALFIPLPGDEGLLKTLTVGVVGVGGAAVITARTARLITPWTPLTYHLTSLRGVLESPSPVDQPTTHMVTLAPGLWAENDLDLAVTHQLTVPTDLMEDR